MRLWVELAVAFAVLVMIGLAWHEQRGEDA